MTIEEIRSAIRSSDYNFLREDKHLGANIILLGLGGSHAYGTNHEGSDLDIRGCALRSREEILTCSGFEQVTRDDPDTTIYAFDKLISLLSACNPNTIEILGLKPEHYLYVSPIGQELLDHKEMFLSRRAVHSFGGYANQQLRRLDNKAARLIGQEQQEHHILNSIENAMTSFRSKYTEFEEGSIVLSVGKSDREEFDSEIFMDVNLSHYPLRDYKAIWAEMNNIVKDYFKIGRRNARAIEKGKLSKHMCHLIRLYLMAFDILERHEIVTYRPEHELLMDIMYGKYLNSENQPTPEFFDMVDEYESRLKYDKDNTDLPENPNIKKIQEFVISVNERVVNGAI